MIIPSRQKSRQGVVFRFKGPMIHRNGLRDNSIDSLDFKATMKGQGRAGGILVFGRHSGLTVGQCWVTSALR